MTRMGLQNTEQKKNPRINSDTKKVNRGNREYFFMTSANQ